MVPANVTAGPPAEIVVPAIEKAEGFGVKNWPATVYTPVAVGVDGSVGSEVVEMPIANAPERPRPTLVLSTHCAAAPGEIVAPLSMKPVGAAVKVWVPRVKTERGGNEKLDEPIKRIPAGS